MQFVIVGVIQVVEDGYYQCVILKEDVLFVEIYEYCLVDVVLMEYWQVFGNEILVQRGLRSQYFSEGFFVRVIEWVCY